ncbi:MAG: hypothetical protein RIA65_18065 [Woeseia sp.]
MATQITMAWQKHKAHFRVSDDLPDLVEFQGEYLEARLLVFTLDYLRRNGLSAEDLSEGID